MSSQNQEDSKLSKILNYLRNFDILVQPYELQAENSQKNSTLLGGCLSLSLFIFGILYFFAVFVRLMQSNSIIYAGTQNKNDQGFELNNRNLEFFIEITVNKKGVGLTDDILRYFDIQVILAQHVRKEGQDGFSKTETPLKLKHCEEKFVDAFNLHDSVFSKQKKQNLICIDQNFTINGAFFDPIFNYISIEVSKCSGSTCKSDQEIVKFLENKVDLDIFIKTSKIKSELNKTSLADITASNIYWRLNSQIANYEDIFLKPVSIDEKQYTLFSYFSGNVDNTKTLFEGTKVSYNNRRSSPVTDHHLMAIFFVLDQNREYYFVIDEHLAGEIFKGVSQVGGLIVAILAVIKVFYGPYFKHKMFETLMNNTFYFDINEKNTSHLLTQKINNSKMKESQKSKDKKQDLHLQSDPAQQESERSLENILIKSNLKKLFDFKLEYPFLSYVWIQILSFFQTYLGCSCTKQKMDKRLILTELGKQKIMNDLDLTNLLKKLYQIDFLKLFLLNPEQLRLFNFFCTPVFSDSEMIKKLELIAKAKQEYQSEDFGRAGKYSRKNRSTVTKILQKSGINAHINFPLVPIQNKIEEYAEVFEAEREEIDANELLNAFVNIQKNNEANNLGLKKCMKFNKKLLTFLKQVAQQYQPSLQMKVDDEIENEDEDENEIESKNKNKNQHVNVRVEDNLQKEDKGMNNMENEDHQLENKNDQNEGSEEGIHQLDPYSKELKVKIK